MTPIEKRTLFRLLLEFQEEDFGNMPGFDAGYWSRENLEAMMFDIEKWMPDAETSSLADCGGI